MSKMRNIGRASGARLYLAASLLLGACQDDGAPAAASGDTPQTEVAAPTQRPYDPAEDLANQERQLQRQAEYQTPEYQTLLLQRSQQNFLDSVAMQAADPERQFVTDICWQYGNGCAGDVRLYSWAEQGHGIVEPVLFTNRTGAVISGHVWATRDGAAQRPAIVITSGSIQASEAMYWWAAQSLAKAGYVVLTSDAQNQGRSDTNGEGDDSDEGVPPQFQGNTFYDGSVDALDFLLSTPAAPYCPQPARSGGDHCAKQTRRAESGLNAGFNPYWAMIDRERIGLAGHSYGAQGVSYIGQQDSRVKAIVAWDNLCDPNGEAAPPTLVGIIESRGLTTNCQTGFQPPTPALRVPALGISNDYLGGPLFPPAEDPLGKSHASRVLSAAGIDSGQLVIRGGTHFEYSYLPLLAFSATLRGIDLSAWYTVGWFDKYLKQDPSADQRLLTTRWQKDAIDAGLDPAGAGNLFSFYYRSRLDLQLADGSRWRCEDLREGCVGMLDDDGQPPDYSYFARVTTAEAELTP